jgi:hypothetical protein
MRRLALPPPVRAGLLGVLLAAGAVCLCPAQEAGPVFLLRTAAGKTLRGPLARLGPGWTVRLGTGVGRSVAGKSVVSLRAEGLALPPLPSDEHLILVNGDRLPVKEVRLDGERLHFRHPDLEGGKETALPLAAVAVFWRTAPEKTAVPEKLRRRLAAGPRTRDTVLLRNGDVLSGTLETLDARSVEVEIDKKRLGARTSQVSAVALSTDLADALRPKGLHARVVLTETERSPGGRLTLVAATSDGKLLRGRTVFGAHLRVPLSRLAALDLAGGAAVYLSDLKPAKYSYFPYLDEHWPWAANASVTGRDLRLGGSTYDRGLGLHAHGRLTYRLDGAYQRFEAVVGLDERDGRRGSVRIRVLADGKPLELGHKGDLTAASGPLPIAVKVAGVKELTLEAACGAAGPVQAVVNWADARLIR